MPPTEVVLTQLARCSKGKAAHFSLSSTRAWYSFLKQISRAASADLSRSAASGLVAPRHVGPTSKFGRLSALTAAVVARIKRAADTILERQIGIALLLICIPIKAERSKPALVSREVRPPLLSTRFKFMRVTAKICAPLVESVQPWIYDAQLGGLHPPRGFRI
jgi:hypothetical protein